MQLIGDVSAPWSVLHLVNPAIVSAFNASPSTSSSTMRPRDLSTQTTVTGSSETALLITAGILGVGAAATIGYFVTKKRRRRTA